MILKPSLLKHNYKDRAHNKEQPSEQKKLFFFRKAHFPSLVPGTPLSPLFPRGAWGRPLSTHGYW